MTFGKCAWDGCTKHAEKAITGAGKAHHAVIRDSRCERCRGHLTSVREVETRRCRRCNGGRTP